MDAHFHPLLLKLKLDIGKVLSRRGHRLMEQQTRQVDRVISEGRGIEGSKILQLQQYLYKIQIHAYVQQ